MEIKEILKLQRKKNNLTQEKLAEKLNISRGAYAKYETGENIPTTIIVLKLATIYGVTTDYLLGRYKEEEYK